jgi:hypothetical protein
LLSIPRNPDPADRAFRKLLWHCCCGIRKFPGPERSIDEAEECGWCAKGFDVETNAFVCSYSETETRKARTVNDDTLIAVD